MSETEERATAPADLVPRTSLAERDRRHAFVRAAMVEAGLDVLVTSPNTGRWEQNLADSRWLSSIGGFGTETLVVFPRAAEPTVFVYNRAEFWRRVQDWIADVRDGRNRWAQNVATRLGEIGFSRGRIGMAGLSGLTRSPDGIVPHGLVAGVASRLPEAELVDATALLRRLRAIKSAEEIAILTRSTAIAEGMLLSLDGLRPGDTDREIYRRLASKQIELGGELPAMILTGSGPSAHHGSFVPTNRRLCSGDLIVGEIEGRYCGYSGQIVRPVVLGETSLAQNALFEAAARVFTAVLSAMRPGVSLGTLADAYDAAVARESGCEARYPLMHARGLGDEEPAIITSADRERLSAVVLRPGMVFVLKPQIVRDGLSGQVGDMVAVTETGATRLGKLPLEPVHIPLG